ncbi:hypothetical protein L2E82_47064 [Cichorium intybus]|uniref:Uncharacterized protein n=1 Tax=Cichorium intybus TaxID=13427 RepID=A0ACB8YVK5_CICIN|nr:hypothetical protein L2E82_47064 [Cichorium intybus]
MLFSTKTEPVKKLPGGNVKKSENEDSYLTWSDVSIWRDLNPLASNETVTSHIFQELFMLIFLYVQMLIEELDEKKKRDIESHMGQSEHVIFLDNNTFGSLFHKTPNGEAEAVAASAELIEAKKLLQNEIQLRKAAEEEINNLRNQIVQWKRSEREKLEEDISILQNQLLQLSFDADEIGTSNSVDMNGEMGSLVSPVRQQQMPYSGEQKGSVAKLFEQVGLQKILSLLEAEDPDVRIHAVKVIANLAAESTNQEKIVEAGGLTSLLSLLTTSDDENIHRVAAGAIANLAMNETNQELIMAQGGISLLAMAKLEPPEGGTFLILQKEVETELKEAAVVSIGTEETQMEKPIDPTSVYKHNWKNSY